MKTWKRLVALALVFLFAMNAMGMADISAIAAAGEEETAPVVTAPVVSEQPTEKSSSEGGVVGGSTDLVIPDTNNEPAADESDPDADAASSDGPAEQPGEDEAVSDETGGEPSGEIVDEPAEEPEGDVNNMQPSEEDEAEEKGPAFVPGLGLIIPVPTEEPAEPAEDGDDAEVAETFTVTYKWTVDGEAQEDIVKADVPSGAELEWPAEIKVLERVGYELTWTVDGEKVDPENDTVIVAADMTVTAEAVKAESEPEEPAAPEEPADPDENEPETAPGFGFVIPVPTDEPADPEATEEPAEPETSAEPEATEEPAEPETGDEPTEEPVEPEVYTLTVDHILSAFIRPWGVLKFHETTTHTLTAEQVAAGVNIAALALSREGMVVTSAKGLTAEDFAGGAAVATITYGIAGGYVATYTGAYMPISVYKGTFNDVEITPEGSYVVSLKFIYDDGTVAAAPVTVSVSQTNADKWSYTMDGHPDESYTVEVEPTNFSYSNGTISGPVSSDNTEITVTFIPQKTTYTVQFREEKDDGELVEIAGKSDMTGIKGDVGEMTNVLSGEVVDLQIKGFEMQELEEIKLDADESKNIVTVKYTRSEYSLNYDTNGGSYVEPKVGKYQDEVSVYTETTTPTERRLICYWYEHTHTDKCYSNGLFGKYRSCGYLYEHTHTDECYEITGGGTTYGGPAPTRQGYTFEGWYTDPACTQKAEPSVTLEDDVTVYAKWTPSTASYTVVYMKELLDEGNNSYYVYYDSATGTATIDSTVTASKIGGISTPDYYKDPVTGEKSTAVVKADGSTVVYMYYDLKEYTYTFSINNNQATLTKGNHKYTNNSSYSFTVKLGMNIGDKWPTANDFTVKGNNSNKNNKNKFNGWHPSGAVSTVRWVTKRIIVTEEMLPSRGIGTDVTFTGDWVKSVSSHKVEYWLQDADGKGYTKSEDYSETYNSDNDSLGKKEIAGFKFSYQNDSYDATRFYYTRNQYSITFKYREQTLKTEINVYFDANIANKNYTPANPVGVESDWVFAGWYDNAACLGEKYTFGAMPSNDLTLFAKFVPPTYTVKFHRNYPDGTDEIVDQKTYTKGAKLEGITPLEDTDDYFFAGWAADKGEYFDPKQQVLHDMDVYGQWKERHTWDYTVYHVFVIDGGEPYTVEVHGTTSKDNDSVTVRAWNAEIPENYRTEYLPDNYTGVIEKNGSHEFTFTYTYFDTMELKYQVFYKYGDKIIDQTEEKTAATVEFDYSVDTAEYNELVRQGYELKQLVQHVKCTSGVTEVVFELKLKSFNIKYEGIEDGNNPNTKTTYTTEEDFYIEQPTRDGYVFVGWTLGEGTAASSGAGHEVMNPHVEKGSTGDLTFKANWEFAAVIRYEAAPEEGGSVTLSAERTFNIVDEEAEGSTAEAKTGWKFVNWTKNGVEVGTKPYFKPDKVKDEDLSARLGYDVWFYESATYVAHFEREVAGLKVEYKTDAGAQLQDPTTKDVPTGDTYTVSTAEGATVKVPEKIDNYVLDHFEGQASGTMTKDGAEVTAVYSLDEDGNGTPDKYEVTVTFEVKNGAWNDGKTDTVTKSYTLATKDEATGTWSKKSEKLEAPAVGNNPDTGYKAGDWNPELPATVTGDATYTYSYVKDSFDVTVKYVADDGTDLNKGDYTEPVEFEATYDVTKQIPDSIEVGGKNYVKETVTGNVSGTMDADGEEITVTYTLDEDGNGTPDKYEVKVTYDVFNGTWAEGDKAQKTEDVVFGEKDGNGNWVEKKEVTLQKVPEGMKADSGYTGGSWAPNTPKTVTKDGNKEFTYTFEKGTFEYTVNYRYDDATETETGSGTFGDEIKYDTKSPKEYGGKNYIYERVETTGDGTITADSSKNVVDVYYTLDENEDGTADKYQVFIKYEVEGEGGTVAPTEAVVTIPGEKQTSGEVTASATATANTGYEFVNWTSDVTIGTTDSEALNQSFTAQGGETYTFTAHFKQIDYTLKYQWGENAPTEVPEGMYLGDGSTIPTLPTVDKSFHYNDTYTVDTTMDGKVVEFVDQYGNVLEKYTFSSWTDPNNGKMPNDNVTITGNWQKETFEAEEYDRTLSYSWTDAPTATPDGMKLGDGSTITELPAGLPTGGIYKVGQEYKIDTKYTSASVVEFTDEYGNVLERYTFSGWDHKDDKMPDANVEVKGSWKKDTFTPDSYNRTLSYSWENAPEATPEGMKLAEGSAIPELPTGGTYKVGQEYTIDTEYTSASVVEFTDQYGNVLEKYTFSGWTDPADGVMPEGKDGVTVTGTWTKVETHEESEYDRTVSYSWENAPEATPEGMQLAEGSELAKLPEGGTYKVGQDYEIDTKYTSDTVVEFTDEYGNVLERYKFSGWDHNGDITITGDVTITGNWEKETVTPKTYGVTYKFEGLPEKANEYSAELPTVPTDDGEYELNQPYTVSETPAVNTVYEVKNENGNTVEKYTFQGWSITGDQKMVEGGVEITGKWTSETVTPETYSVTYKFEGLPEEQPEYGDTLPELPTDDGEYEKNQPYTVKDTPAAGAAYEVKDQYKNVTGTYTFEGWKDAEGNIVNGEQKMVEGGVKYTGKWTYTERPESEYKFDVTVKYQDENGDKLKDAYTETFATNEGYNVSDKIDDAFDANEHHYVKDSIIGDPEGVMDEADVEIVVTYAIDDKGGEDGHGDGTADKYQVFIQYESADETMGTVTEPEQVINLGENVTEDTVTASATATAAEGYAFDGWTDSEGNKIDAEAELAYEFDAKGGETYTFTAHFAKDTLGPDPENPEDPETGDDIPDKYQVKVTYSAEGNGSVDPAGSEMTTFADGAEEGNVTVHSVATANPGFMFDHWELNGEAIESGYELDNSFNSEGDHVYEYVAYFIPVTSTDPEEPEPPVDPEDPDEPDPPVDPEDPDQPDPPVDPDDPDVPEPPVDPDDPTPPAPVDPVIPDTPDTPDTPYTPDTPDTPDAPETPDDGPAPAEDGPATVEIGDDAVPMADLPVDQGLDYDLSETENIEDNATPLGLMDDIQNCCILHFLLMLCALAVAVYYTYDAKRRQKKEFEVRSELGE